MAKRICEVTNTFFAKLIEKSNKFDGFWLSGLANSLHNGYKDDGTLPAYFYHSLIQSLRHHCSLPIFLDCNNGSDEDLMSANADFHVIEDTKGQKINSFEGKARELFNINQFCDKINKHSSHKNIIARTECLVAGGSVNETILRCKKYYSAGAVAVFVHSKSNNVANITNIVSQLSIPIIICPTTYPITDDLKENVEWIIFANQISRFLAGNFNNILDNIIKHNDDQMIPVHELLDYYNDG